MKPMLPAMLRHALQAALALLLLTAIGAVALLAATLQREPAVALEQAPEASDVARALTLLRTHDPRRAAPGIVRAVTVSERDVDVLLNHAAARRVDAVTRVSLQRGTAVVLSSVHLPANPLFNMFGRWLNLQVQLVETGRLPAVVGLRAGGLPVPTWLGERFAPRLLRELGVGTELQLVTDVVQRVGFAPQQMVLVYAWHDDSTDRVLAALVPLPEQQRLRAYSDRLSALTTSMRPGWTTSLAPLLGPMFTLARERSAAAGNSMQAAAAENRAAIVVLTLFVNGRGVDALLPAARSWPRARQLQVTLAERDDFPRHLLVSAALAAEGSGQLSKAIGIYKEVADSRGGSGFSFNDMAANRAGTRLGELAMNAPRQLQDKLAVGVAEADFMPPVADLPEFMTEAEFLRRYGGVDTPAYAAMMVDIEHRVDALPVLK